MKLRRYHRWLAPLFAFILLWIAVTGLTIQYLQLTTPAKPGAEEASLIVGPARAHEHEVPVAKVAPLPTIAPPTPETAIDRERREHHDLSEFVMDLHSGKILGAVGTWLSILSGVVLIFLAGSGLWMYWQMFRARGRRDGQPRWFW